MSVSYVSAKDIDSSGGRRIVDTGGVLLRTVNWFLFDSSLANGGAKFGRGRAKWGRFGVFGGR